MHIYTYICIYIYIYITQKLNYTEENNEIKQKSRKRNILWFNPPYSISVKTNIGKLFRCLKNKNFPPIHKYRKIFNRNTVKKAIHACPASNQKLVHITKRY